MTGGDSASTSSWNIADSGRFPRRRQMEWTPELDKAITELHAKRLGNAFISKWLRLNPSHVRARLMALGLLKSRSNAARAAAASSIAGEAHDQDNADLLGDDEDD